MFLVLGEDLLGNLVGAVLLTLSEKYVVRIRFGVCQIC